MISFRILRRNLSTKDRPRLLAVAAFSGLALVCIVLGGLLWRQVRTRGALSSRLTSLQRQLIQHEKLRHDKPQRLREQIVAARATLTSTLALFPNEAQAADELQKVYTYAKQYGVTIDKFEVLPTPKQEELPAELRVKRFGLQARGDFQRLAALVARIEGSGVKTLSLSEVSIEKENGGHLLRMDITLHSAPSSPGTTLRPRPRPTRAALPTPAEREPQLPGLEEQLDTAWAEEDWETVIGLLAHIQETDPEYESLTEKLYATHVNYGFRLMEEGKLTEAKAQFGLALSIKPGGAEAISGLEQLAARVPGAPPTPTATPVPTATPTPTPVPRFIIHQVRPDDTLFSLARRYCASTEAIMAVNSLASPTIRTGQYLRIPTDTTIPPPGYIAYEVRGGDTLFSIAQRYHTTADAIKWANGLISPAIRPGQILRIPTYLVE